jgi:DNA-binding transcriptional MerR regulator
MNLQTLGPSKSNFKFNEVTSMTGVKPYVLRFWESEFDQISPKMNENGQKIYAQADIVAIDKVKKLLFEDKLSIPQAKGYLDREMVNFEEEVELEEEQPVSLASRSMDLKKALEEIIEKNSVPKELSEEIPPLPVMEEELGPDVIVGENLQMPQSMAQAKAQNIADTLKEEIKQQRHLLDKDVVNLVSAKKKLTVLTVRIDEICQRYNWQ